MSTITAGKARLSDLNAADKAKISRLAEEVLRLRNQLAATTVNKRDSADAKQTAAVATAAATQNVHPNSSESDSDFDMGAALREAAASLAAADAAQR
jgi:hypothetical protein